MRATEGVLLGVLVVLTASDDGSHSPILRYNVSCLNQNKFQLRLISRVLPLPSPLTPMSSRTVDSRCRLHGLLLRTVYGIVCLPSESREHIWFGVELRVASLHLRVVKPSNSIYSALNHP